MAGIYDSQMQRIHDTAKAREEKDMKTQLAPYSDHNDELVWLRHQEADLKARIEKLERRVKWLEEGKRLIEESLEPINGVMPCGCNTDVVIGGSVICDEHKWLTAEPKEN